MCGVGWLGHMPSLRRSAWVRMAIEAVGSVRFLAAPDIASTLKFDSQSGDRRAAGLNELESRARLAIRWSVLNEAPHRLLAQTPRHLVGPRNSTVKRQTWRFP